MQARLLSLAVAGIGAFLVIGCFCMSRPPLGPSGGTPLTARIPSMTPPPLIASPPTPASTETYEAIHENEFHQAAQTPLSTFAVDVDTAAYSNVRRFLQQENKLLPVDAVRIEELVNYFHYDYPEPNDEHPVAITTEVSSCPWQPEHRLVRIGLQAKRIHPEQLPPRNLVFLIDVSGSMNAANRLPLVKQSLEMLVDQLRAQDHVAIVTYAGNSGLSLPSTSGERKDKIRAALTKMEAGGSTNGGEGIQLAYKVAQEHFLKDGVNRVILATDGDFNVGVTSQDDLVKLIEEKRRGGVFLTVLGYGMGNLKDATLEKLADRGNGHYAYIDGPAEARKVFVEEGAALVTVAKDVKVQVEFNPARVSGYRLIGYENRALEAKDFNDDRKDGGDMGAGHTVTALYECVAAGQPVPTTVDPLKYQPTPTAPPLGNASDEMLTVKVRYKEPKERTSRLLSRSVVDGGAAIDQASVDQRFAAAVAAFGMLLRDSAFKGDAGYEGTAALARSSVGADPRGYRSEFVRLIELARSLSTTNHETVSK